MHSSLEESSTPSLQLAGTACKVAHNRSGARAETQMQCAMPMTSTDGKPSNLFKAFTLTDPNTVD